MTNYQALGQLIKAYGQYKPGMKSRVMGVAKLRPLTACVTVMAELQRHVNKDLCTRLGPAYDELYAHPLTNARPTAEQLCELYREA